MDVLHKKILNTLAQQSEAITAAKLARLIDESKLMTNAALVILHTFNRVMEESYKKPYLYVITDEGMDALERLKDTTENVIPAKSEEPVKPAKAKLTIDTINQDIDTMKTQLNAKVDDYDLKVAALKKIGEIMSDDIQELMYEIISDLTVSAWKENTAKKT